MIIIPCCRWERRVYGLGKKSMSLKKLIISLLFGMSLCSISAVFAGGPMDAVAPPEPVDYSGVYVDLSAGYANVNWSSSTIGVLNGFSPTVNGAPNGNARGGFSGGGDIGYQINRYLGLEFAWYSLPKVTGVSDVAMTLPAVTIRSWVADFALKMMAPIWGKLDIFAKVGPSYRSLRYTGTGSITAGFGGQKDQYWSVMFAAGLQYWLDQNWVISAQYLHFAEYTRGGNVNRQAPTAHLYMGSVGYKFTL